MSKLLADLAVLLGLFLGNDPALFQHAVTLREEGKDNEAFRTFLRVPGGEHAALGIARPRAPEFLKILRDEAKGVPVPRAKMVEGDLLLALGKKDEALACYRAAAAKISRKAGDGWAKGLTPPDYYFVEPPPDPPAQRFFAGSWLYQPSEPFSRGPGSQRDNWLLRRFLALDAWDDAAAEFARLWEIHRRNSQPYVASFHEATAKPDEFVLRDRVVTPHGFDGQGLLFALDYAYFCKRRQEIDKALAVLREPLLQIDLDRDPNRPEVGEPLPPDKPPPHPRRPLPTHRWSSRSPVDLGIFPGVLPHDFIRLTYGEFKQAKKEEPLVRALEKEIAGGRNSLRRVLARIRLH
jgi:tetratricopeptide (TPR) repeat protein